ncbi:MAG: hypothetical protein ACI4GZ_03170 [Ruminococcus sp.]
MSSLDSLILRLSPLGVYSLEENTAVYSELSAYAVGLDILRETLDTMIRECFFASAESYGLRNAEILLGKSREDLPLEKRREMLIARNSLGVNDFTLQGMEKILNLLGVEGVIEEFPALQRISVNLGATLCTRGEKNFIISQIESLFPSHLEADVAFGGMSWAYIEMQQLTFDKMEQKGYSWQEIDIL